MLKKQEKPENTQIIDELNRVEEQLRKNELLFNMSEDAEIIEAIIYERRSLQSRYTFLIRQAKEKGIKINFTDRL